MRLPTPLKSLQRKRARSQRRLHVERLEARMVLATGPIVINELLADNNNVIDDLDGDSSDYIELFNPTSQTVNLDGWHLTDDPSDLTQWTLPAVSLDPGEYLTVFASSKDRTNPAAPLHTNFGLSAAGEYLALVQADGSTIAHEFSPAYPEQFEDISYGLSQNVTPLLQQGAFTSYLVPTASDASLGTSWTTPSFNPTGWNTGSTGLGFSTSVDNFSVTYIEANTTVSHISVAEDVLTTPSLQASVTETTADVINYYGTGGQAHFGNNNPFPTQSLGENVDNFLIEATAQVVLPTAGPWTFGVNSDDGFRLQLEGQGEEFQIEFPGTRGAGDTLGTFNAPTAGVYNLRMLMYEQGGGASTEMFAAAGSHTSFNNDFELIGDSANGGLETVGFAGAISTDVGSDMLGLNSSLWTRTKFTVIDPAQYDAFTLNMQYDDGFVLYLNGTEIIRRNAPSSPQWNSSSASERDVSLGSIPEAINLTPFRSLLVEGTNYLAVHGLNFAASDEEFLIAPEIEGVKNEPTERYFSQPSPGSPNAGEFVSYVEDTKFSVDRGFFEAPFQLDITTATPDATIRYTTDGSQPTLSHGSTFSSTLTINQTTTLRARAFREGFEPTDIDTQTYIFLADVLQQSPDGSPPAGWPAGPVNGQVLDYGMDPEIVNDPVWGPQMIEALSSISTISLTTDLANLLDPETGIYTHAGNRGRELWERPVSVELLSPDGSEAGFQHDSGLRIRGGFSRSSNNPKHSFRLFFRSEYDDELNYPFFGDEGVDVFHNLDLRTSQNYSWAFRGDSRNTLNRDVFSRDLMRDLQQPYTRSRYHHLYLNGQYWGLYQTEERPEAEFAETYFGGDKDDYDAVKTAGSSAGYTIEATDGTLDAWHSLYQQARDAYTDWEISAANEEDRVYDESVYFRLQGLLPDGTRDPSEPVLLDVDNLIDYMVMIVYGGNLDSPLSNFLGNARPNNWFSIYNRNGETGFQFMAHDSEHTLLNVNQDRVGPFFHPNQDDLRYSNPQWLHQDLTASAEYRLRFADRVQKHFFEGGAVTADAGIDRFLARAEELSLPIIAESARWGDAKQTTPLTKNDWQNTIDYIADDYLPQRSDIVLGQLTAEDLFPSFDTTPAYRINGSPLPGGQIAESDQVSLVVPGNTEDLSLIELGADWNYLDNGSNQGTAWRNTSFNDSSWSTGPAELGYGDNDEATEVSFGPNSNNKYITTYFRHEFSITDPGQYTELAGQLQRDDGAVVYLNGVEVHRSNMPTGNITHTTMASGTVGGGNESALRSFTLDPGLLTSGTNVIAVEVHQSVVNSSDISFNLGLTGSVLLPAMDIYFTTDGTDPRLPGGAINSSATSYNGTPFTLPASTQLLARTYDDDLDRWSPVAEAQFFLHEAATASNLALTELNYNPHDPTANELAIDPDLENDDFEFLEFRNVGANTIDLTAAQLIEGIEFTFPAGSQSVLAPGEYLVIAANPQAFVLRYGDDMTIAGQYSSSLSGSGEELEMIDRFGQPIFLFEYEDGGDWPGRADGDGSSLERIDLQLPYDDADNWESSTSFGGTPGADRLIESGAVQINEVLTHTDPPLYDSIELYNSTSNPIDISGWWLSDDQAVYDAFIVPAGTVIPADGYVVFDENDFNVGQSTSNFRLNSSVGESLWLVATVGGNPTRFADNLDFIAAPNGESFGRWPNGEGDLYPMLSRSLGSANPGPRVGPIVISELMYNPAPPSGGGPDDHLEYIEIENPTGSAVDLTEWTLSGVDFAFPAGLMLPAGEVLVVTTFDPTDPDDASLLADFEATYGVSAANLTLLGPYGGQLSNGGERIRLHRADQPPAEFPDLYPQLLEDEVDYSDSPAWPGSADGGGESLNRLACTSWGNDPASWQGREPTPGTESCGQTSTVVGRYLFYNDSAFDGNSTAINSADDQAIDPLKQALLPGAGTASFANYTTTVNGITGIMIDIDQLPAGALLSAADFEFRMGNSQDTGSWAAAPQPIGLDLRTGAGDGGSDRITLTWTPGNLVGKWLEVRVKSTSQTGLTTDDLFYFGNAPGDTGDSATDTEVGGSDFMAVRNHRSSFLNPVGLGNVHDHNRDGRVNATDLVVVRDHATNMSTRLVLLSLPAAQLQSGGEGEAKQGGDATYRTASPAIAFPGEARQSSSTQLAEKTVVTTDPPPLLDDSIELYLADYQPPSEIAFDDTAAKSLESTDKALLEWLDELAIGQ